MGATILCQQDAGQLTHQQKVWNWQECLYCRITAQKINSITQTSAFILQNRELHARNVFKNQTISQFEVEILLYIKISNMTPQRCPDSLVAKFWRVADVYEEGTLKDVFVEGVDASFRHVPRYYWSPHPFANSTIVNLTGDLHPLSQNTKCFCDYEIAEHLQIGENFWQKCSE